VKPYYQDENVTLYKGDCREVMAQLEAESITTIITDPPYGLEFMGKNWDRAVPGPDFWDPALRICKPGAMLLAFGGTRLYHRMICAIEDAGWEIRDCLMWLYGSGFPKSMDISKAVEKTDKIGTPRERALKFTDWMRSTGITAKEINEATDSNMASHYLTDKQQPAIATMDMYEKMKDLLPEPPEDIMELIRWRTVEAENMKRREVIGTRKGKDAVNGDMYRPGEGNYIQKRFDITKPFTPEAKEWDGWGTALKPAWEPIVMAMKPMPGTFAENALKYGVAGLNIDAGRTAEKAKSFKDNREDKIQQNAYGKDGVADYDGSKGRWPANLLLDEFTAPMVDEQTNEGTSRFFYIAKPDKKDRGQREDVEMPLFAAKDEGFRNTHPTVKPTPLMHRLIALQAHLARLTSMPDGGVILDPFGGSGTTAVAAKQAGRKCISIEMDESSLEITVERLKLSY
jgi:site-specific DNA-methyltransferase (adenine-specific)